MFKVHANVQMLVRRKDDVLGLCIGTLELEPLSVRFLSPVMVRSEPLLMRATSEYSEAFSWGIEDTFTVRIKLK